MKLWEYKWFQKFISWCRKWKWFDEKIYGKSINLEDFVRNPAEVLRDETFPFVIKDVNAYSVFNIRIGYKHYIKDKSPKNSFNVPMGNNHNFIIRNNKYSDWTILDLRLCNKYWTKFCNCILFAQLAVSFPNKRYRYIPIPYISLNIRFSEYRYFQFGLGWGPENGNTVLCAKFRFVNQKTSSENKWNIYDIIGFWEGTV